ncbi:hypothetical protein B2I21_28390, partial [Chryseobacterium mucoviscidosis]
HSEEIFIEDLKTLDNFGSDHLPVFCEFFIDYEQEEEQEERIDYATEEEKAEAEEMIEEGKEEDGERDAVVTED